MSNGINRFQNKMVRIGTIGGGIIFGGAVLGPYIMPFLPLIIAAAASIAVGLCVRGIFTRKMNRRLNRPYRYTGGDASFASSKSFKNAPKPNKKTARRDAKKARGRVEDESNARTNPPPPPDSLSLYRNLLGLRQGFTSDELKAAYHDAAAKYHPDRYASASRRDRENAESVMKQINEAYAILKAV
jgi:curved DNA-binding protein CbpA